MKHDILRSIKDIGLCLKTLIKARFNKNTKVIYTSSGRYKSLYISFYKNHIWQFYIEDKVSYYMIYLLKDNKVAKKDVLKKGETIDRFYTRILHFINLI